MTEITEMTKYGQKRIAQRKCLDHGLFNLSIKNRFRFSYAFGKIENTHAPLALPVSVLGESLRNVEILVFMKAC